MTSPTATLVQPLSAKPARFYQDYCFDHSQFNQPYGKTSILTADDEPVVRFTQRAILEIAGYEVLSAADGCEALAVFATQHVDLAILDFCMPGLDGGSLARELKRLKPHLPVILLSGGRVDEESKSAVDCFLAKGQSPALLLREVERLLTTSKLPVRAAPVL